ncbi:MAG: hypothetical protein HY700_10800 [Gemmatimonadetes bacterium]|nr:hypothetical protein [Gemmatimonadota bacterium]
MSDQVDAAFRAIGIMGAVAFVLAMLGNLWLRYDQRRAERKAAGKPRAN